MIAKGLMANSIPFRPFQDDHPDPDEPYYRMKAVNAAGISEPSNLENVAPSTDLVQQQA